MKFIKFVRTFLFILILIGLGLLITHKIWVPRLVNLIIAHSEIQTVVTGDQTKIDQTQIIFPKGEESFVAGKTYTLKWSSGPNPIDIYLVDASLKKFGTSISLVDRVYAIDNTGHYNYTFPTENIKEDGIYEFQIGNVDSGDFKIKFK